jgi:hypothetical protein
MDRSSTFKSHQLDHSCVQSNSALVWLRAFRDSKLPRPSAPSRRRGSARAPDIDSAMPLDQATLEEHEETFAEKSVSSCIISKHTRAPTDLAAGGMAALWDYGFDSGWDDC